MMDLNSLNCLFLCPTNRRQLKVRLLRLKTTFIQGPKFKSTTRHKIDRCDNTVMSTSVHKNTRGEKDPFPSVRVYVVLNVKTRVRKVHEKTSPGF